MKRIRCNSADAVSVRTAAANLLFVVAPLAIIGGIRYRRRVYKQ